MTTEPMTTDPGTGTGEPPPDEAAQLCQRWNGDRAQLARGRGAGTRRAADEGAVSRDGRDNALRLVNLYRWIADLPPVTEDAGKTGSAQACALMMHAKGR